MPMTVCYTRFFAVDYRDLRKSCNMHPRFLKQELDIIVKETEKHKISDQS